MGISASPWRLDPDLVGKFHPEHPDDLEVHFILVAHKTIETMWVRLDEMVTSIGYRGGLLNRSRHVAELAPGTRALVRPSVSHPPAVWVPDDVTARNLRDYSTVCEDCGFDLMFMPVAELARIKFPSAPAGAVIDRMTTHCEMCGGTMHVRRLVRLAPA